MHDNHKHHHHDHDQSVKNDDLNKLLILIDHWIEHDDSHTEAYRIWAGKASGQGEDEIAKEIHLAVKDSEAVKGHLKRAKAILAAKMVLRK